ncbi:threonine synthase [Puniceicoccus vermicola]|uniref:Threonine synthase n=1 Tax=Puniceicoccus vermicola TaxID=388746 RepID=A0A7X1B2L0_9BACT|nr:threonine synthase [Puniceicoccus vermicola]MBC2604352.1 threonine synthase [Puniceicoccus vermicola]
MKFVSTRGGVEPVSFQKAVSTGLAPDGGLFVPEKLPDLATEISSWEGLSYPELCIRLFSHFATDTDSAELRETVENAYASFDDPETAPLRRLGEGLSVLELFHGPTLAFKDFALQWLGELYEKQIARDSRSIAVLGATSGDTGAAAIHGLLGKEGVSIFILYPDGRVSPLQERQMTCTEAENVFPLAIQGSFDDAQKSLKEVFGDQDFRAECGLSAVNSINLARILAQCAYYIYAALKIPAERREKIRFVVPTGNFGNVLAGWMAYRMGMPASGFVVATNQNDILHRFFSTGRYEVGDVRPSLAPSMDIQVASNFERFLYYRVDGDSSKVSSWMKEFASSGRVELPAPEGWGFTSTATDDGEIEGIIRSVHQEFDYVVDPHTACGFSWDRREGEETIILSTAHPAKFPETIEKATGLVVTHPSLEELKAKKIVKFPIEATSTNIQDFIRSHLPS